MKQVAVPNYKIYFFNLKYLSWYKNNLILNNEATDSLVSDACGSDSLCVKKIIMMRENVLFSREIQFLGEAHETMSWEHREGILRFAVL